MTRPFALTLAALAVATGAFAVWARNAALPAATDAALDRPAKPLMVPANARVAVFSGGCFWGTEEAFRTVPGVLATQVGYTGGTVPNPTYRTAHTKGNGYVESAQIVYDPKRVRYETLLATFFATHDPTAPRPGSRIGSPYRSFVWAQDDDQARTAQAVIASLNRSKRFAFPIQTQVRPALGVYSALGARPALPFYPRRTAAPSVLRKAWRRGDMPAIDGFVSINKPAGMTSHDVVARVRRVLQTKRAGHAGTLDPDATGVLVVALGQATRLLPYLPLEPKKYVARAAFGTSTTTEDASGETTATADASDLTEERLRAALPAFIGEIQQVPPMVSAVHHEGKRLYELARQGITVEREARAARIFAIELSDFAPGETAEATLAVSCGTGTYIRTLCADLGQSVGLPAHMKTLVRTAVGTFPLESAVPLENLSPEAVSPMETALAFPVVNVEYDAAKDLLMGRAIPVAAQTGTVALHFDGWLLALAEANAETGTAHPFKVFPQRWNEAEARRYI